jgi:hypothetical protein
VLSRCLWRIARRNESFAPCTLSLKVVSVTSTVPAIV